MHGGSNKLSLIELYLYHSENYMLNILGQLIGSRSVYILLLVLLINLMESNILTSIKCLFSYSFIKQTHSDL